MDDTWTVRARLLLLATSIVIVATFHASPRSLARGKTGGEISGQKNDGWIVSPEQRGLEAADGGGRSGVAQIWQHFLRDVLLEKLQRPSGGGVVAVDHCKDETNVLRCVHVSKAYVRERGGREEGKKLRERERERENRGHGNGGGSSSLARGKSIVARDNASPRVFYSTRVAKYFSFFSFFIFLFFFVKISYDGIERDSNATGSTISTHFSLSLPFLFFFFPPFVH